MVHATAVDGLKGERLRVGMVGGGRNAFIGAVHRMAMRLDDLIELKAGALSSDAENARASGADLGLAPDRTYSDYREMAVRKAARPDGIEAVVIVTPNHLHFPVAKAFLEAGIAVICDKPLSTTLAEASELVELTREGAHFRGDIEQYRLSDGAPGARNDRSWRTRRHSDRPRGLCPGLADAADRRRRTQAGGMAHGSHSRRRFRMPRRHRRPRAQSDAVCDRTRTRRGFSGTHDLRAGPPPRRQRARAAAVSGRSARRAGSEPGRGRQSQQSEYQG